MMTHTTIVTVMNCSSGGCSVFEYMYKSPSPYHAIHFFLCDNVTTGHIALYVYTCMCTLLSRSMYQLRVMASPHFLFSLPLLLDTLSTLITPAQASLQEAR